MTMNDYLQKIEQPFVRKLLVIPLIIWFILYITAPYIPNSIKPEVDVYTLYQLDMAFFNALPSTIVPGLMQCDFLDVVGAIAYSLHIVWPISFLLYCIFKRRDIVLAFVNCFGMLNLSGVMTQYVFPTAPPWYYYKYKFAEASYDMKGDPAGLMRVDEKYGIKVYENMFQNNPMVYGSFPSLHVAWPTMTCLFVVHETELPRWLKVLSIFYVVYLVWAVIYLQHHYAADVLGGSFYSWCIYRLFGPKRAEQPNVFPECNNCIDV